MTDLLFVYGSLISAARHPKGEQLRQEAELVGAATLHGRLYRVSWYPGVVPGGEPADRVHGELYRLRTPAVTLAWLDAYEGLSPGPDGVTPAGEYRRAVIDARKDDDATVAAWGYLYQDRTDVLVRVPSGRWSDTL